MMIDTKLGPVRIYPLRANQACVATESPERITIRGVEYSFRCWIDRDVAGNWSLHMRDDFPTLPEVYMMRKDTYTEPSTSARDKALEVISAAAIEWAQSDEGILALAEAEMGFAEKEVEARDAMVDQVREALDEAIVEYRKALDRKHDAKQHLMLVRNVQARVRQAEEALA